MCSNGKCSRLEIKSPHHGVVLPLVDGNSTLLLWTPLWTPLYGKDLGYHNSRWLLIGSTYRPYPKSIPLPQRLPSTPALSHSSTIVKSSLSPYFLSCYPKIHCHSQSNLFEDTSHVLSHAPPPPRYLKFSKCLPTTLTLKNKPCGRPSVISMAWPRLALWLYFLCLPPPPLWDDHFLCPNHTHANFFLFFHPENSLPKGLMSSWLFAPDTSYSLSVPQSGDQRANEINNRDQGYILVQLRYYMEDNI